ncbi:MAG: 1-acyl-sn-glycerol-3-phosphate acyltransferase [Oscillospiraceae bacterium]|nr:1-acyl-sn-glycerol-3-phosphate acyltransferase [Oscillospiraceae bacterium]
MIIGSHKDEVIKNIEEKVAEQDFNSKVEVDDAVLSRDEKNALIDEFIANSKTLKKYVDTLCARAITDTVSRMVNRRTRVEGAKNIIGITTGAIITSNHFNPLDTTIVHTAMRRTGHKHMRIVSQETNFAMGGFLGYIMKNADTIPLPSQKERRSEFFSERIRQELRRNSVILIYPEQEMWFNYRKPRPPKRGAYYYAAENNVPIISCFVEIRDTDEMDNDEFYKTEYVIHILKPIYPDPDKSARENSFIMMETDYQQKIEAYEKAYSKKLVYDFEDSDIAGWIGRNPFKSKSTALAPMSVVEDHKKKSAERKIRRSERRECKRVRRKTNISRIFRKKG